MRKFFKNIFIFCSALFLAVLIIQDVDEEIRLSVITFCVVVGGIFAMVLFFLRARKKGGRGEQQRMIERKNAGWKLNR